MNYYEIQTVRGAMHLSRVTSGSHHFGWMTNYENAEKLLSCYIENGGNLLDTARCAEYHKSEEFIGQFLKDRPGLREKVCICTKWDNPIFNTEHTNVERFRFSRENFEGDLAESLRILQTDYIDIYLMHKYSPDLDVQAVDKKNKPENIQRLKRVRVLCEEKNLTPQQVVLGFFSGHDVPAIPIITTKSTDHMTDALTARNISLTKEDVLFL